MQSETVKQEVLLFGSVPVVTKKKPPAFRVLIRMHPVHVKPRDQCFAATSPSCSKSSYKIAENLPFLLLRRSKLS